ncbi:hypothetical protein HGRIS_003174 [Hohenbuehelia grisea]|uniref:Exonuclease domain-containing protein n=1 Tax=Hohenbuehelia grisea TaxID=104357 RepID=A0ABR3JP19_9AGAR
MKRAQASSPVLSTSPQHKKFKPFAGLPTAEDDAPGDWTKVEKRKQKKVKKTEGKSESTQPRFMYNSGEIVRRNQAIAIDDIRELVVHILGDAPPPNWLRVENAPSIQKVVAIMIPGLTADILSLPPIPTSATTNPNLPLAIPLPTKPSDDSEKLPAGVPFIASTFSHACPTRAPGDQTHMYSVLSAFFQGPISFEERKKRLVEKLASERGPSKGPSEYMIPLEQMVENDYPIPSYMADIFEKPDGWVETPEPSKEPSSEKQRIYALDCEMCMTEDGKELARISLIDYDSGIAVYDQFVKPAKPITDYLTKWSGITAESLESTTTTLTQVQAHLLRLLSPPAPNPFALEPSQPMPVPPTPILLGHSLESDLKALKLCHPYCIDTALLYHHPRGRPLKPGLAWLTRKWCGREIQNRGEGGHDPEEDARACLDLLKKKVEMGPGFGEFKVDYESVFERLKRSTRRAGGAAGSIRSAVIDHGNPSFMHGSKADTAIGCKTDEEVLSHLLEAIPSHHLAFGRFMGLAEVLGWNTPRASPDAPPPPPSPPASPEALASALDSLNKSLVTLHTALPSRTAIIIFTGHSEPRRMAQLSARRSAFETAVRNGKAPESLGPETRWTMADGRDLEEEVEKAKRGLLFLGIKP